MNDQVTREVTLPAPPEEVWDALTDPERLAAWLAEDAEIELRPGGEASFDLPDGDRRTGFVDSVEPPSRLSFWWRSGDADGGDAGDDDLRRVEFSLVGVPEGTRLRVVESRSAPVLDLRGSPLAAHPGEHGPPAPSAHAGPMLAHA